MDIIYWNRIQYYQLWQIETEISSFYLQYTILAEELSGEYESVSSDNHLNRSRLDFLSWQHSTRDRASCVIFQTVQFKRQVKCPFN